ncbi:MAG: lipid-A-disaccharide synthase [Planctomycetota bacterium]|jgi:lipid-A-disaccharide synthase
MAGSEKQYRVFISAAEPSGDSHCAGLITAMGKLRGDVEFVGVGGPKMAEAGCELMETTVGRASMLYNAFSHVVHYYKLLRQIRRYLEENRVDLVVVCDSPAFNFHVAKAAKRVGIGTVFYVAPQLWAWAAWRIAKLRRHCDKLCCILPFEQDWFGSRGVETVFVGHPLLDEARTEARAHEDFEARSVRVALMPGSRAAEVKSLWGPMQKIAGRIREKFADASFVTVAVDEEGRRKLEAAQIAGFECEYSVRTVSETARQADFAIVASGSATLQVAAAGCPMVIMYQSSSVLWHLVGRWLVKTEYLSLVNVLGGREVVPEFMPYFASVEPIAKKCVELIADRDRLRKVSGELVELVQPLRASNASERTAEIVGGMLGG